ncbi:hypothetical protein E2542_SST20800 [Spatholobus suberectus]|nr:hypothetical protein E2542_SST20800 [Spatholobus suberectus]
MHHLCPRSRRHPSLSRGFAACQALVRTTGVSNPIRSPSFRLSVSVSAQQSAFAVGVLSDLYAFHRSTGNSLCPYRTPACPSVADHPLGPATDHRLGKLLPHQLANQTQAPPRADSSFCSSAYGVLAAVSSCCSPPKGRFLRVTHPSATGNTTSRPTCMCNACRQRSS